MYNYYNPPGVYNPVVPMQQRLNQMEQQFPQYSQPYGNQQSSQPIMALKGRAVTSLDEAKAAMIDLDGSMFIFPDIANKKIYTKQINLDGTATLNTYNLDEPITTPVPQTEMSVKRGELDEVVNYLKNDIHTLEMKFAQLNQEVMDNVQSYAINDVSDAKPIDEQPLVQESARNGKWKK